MARYKKGFKIYRDNINKDEDENLAGKEYFGYKGGKNRFRLLDDDGVVYFYLYSDIDIDVDDYYDDTIFLPLDAIGEDYGCSSIQYWDKVKEKYEDL